MYYFNKLSKSQLPYWKNSLHNVVANQPTQTSVFNVGICEDKLDCGPRARCEVFPRAICREFPKAICEVFPRTIYGVFPRECSTSCYK